MKKILTLIVAIVLALLVVGVSNASAQNVVLKGKTFVQEAVQKDSVNTGYEYMDRDGVKHTVYLSKSGKAYIWAVSKKSGKRYKRYLPKVTQMLKEANKNE